MTTPTKPALPEPAAWQSPDGSIREDEGQGEPPFSDWTPLYTQAAIEAAVAEKAQALASALGWPGGISDPVQDWPTLLRAVAEARAETEALKSDIADALTTIAVYEAEARAVPEGWKLLKDTTHTERSWPEDRSHENGNYSNTCVRCLREFVGHKRRQVCKVCAATPSSAEQPKPAVIDTADTVLHKPSGESWIVAFVQDGRLCACGWPLEFVPVEDCDLVEKATPESRAKLLRQMADISESDPRRTYARAALQGEPHDQPR